MKQVLTDFKTERNDILPALPGSLRIVPTAFYLGVVGIIAMAGYSFYEVRNLNKETEEKRALEQQELGRIKAQQALEQGLITEKKNALEVQAWIAANSDVYPLVLKVARTVDPNTTISELTLSRQPDNPSHLKMGMSIYSQQGNEQIEALTQAISDTLNLRNYGAAVTISDKDANELVYECSWAPATVAANASEDK